MDWWPEMVQIAVQSAWNSAERGDHRRLLWPEQYLIVGRTEKLRRSLMKVRPRAQTVIFARLSR